MRKYIIYYDYGYGGEAEVIEAKSLEAAEGYAYQAWREGAESEAEYWAKKYTDELSEEYGLKE